jgi:predicted enzyme related to lactoylglutathione lyase
MPAILRHFAINADSVQRAKAFYEKVFGWEFRPWGPPNFYQVWNAGTGFIGALHERRELAKGQRINGFEVSFQVPDIRAALKAAEDNGGRILMPPYLIEGVGEVAYFEDSEGNACGVAQYLPSVWS